MPEVSSPELEPPAPTIPDGDGAVTIAEDWDAPGARLSADGLPERVREVVGRRDATTEVFANDGGTADHLARSSTGCAA
jgi:hypothetical protein